LRADRAGLEGECRAFTRHLAGVEATEYVIAKYAAAHDALETLEPAGRFDTILVGLARGPALLRWPATAFARFHAPTTVLQNKLVVLLSILETVPPSSRVLNRAPSRHAAWLILVLGLRTALAVTALFVGTVFLAPLRWVLAERPDAT